MKVELTVEELRELVRGNGRVDKNRCPTTITEDEFIQMIDHCSDQRSQKTSGE